MPDGSPKRYFICGVKAIRNINRDKDKMRILGITIPEEKRLEIGLTTLFWGWPFPSPANFE